MHIFRRCVLAAALAIVCHGTAHAQATPATSQTTDVTQFRCRIGNGGGVKQRLYGVGSPAGQCGRPLAGLEVSVIDASAKGDCSTGGGTVITTCVYNPSAAGANKWESPAPTGGGGGGGTPGGSNTQIQINQGGAFGGSANLTFDGTTLLLGGPSGGFKIDPSLGSNGFYYISAVADPAASRLLLLDDASVLPLDYFLFKNAAQTITGKTISGASNTITNLGTSAFVDGSVTLAKLANLATDRLIGRDTAGTGSPEPITVGGGLEFTGSAGIQRSALTGDVTASAGSNATTIAAGAITSAKMATQTGTITFSGGGKITGLPASSASSDPVTKAEILAASEVQNQLYSPTTPGDWSSVPATLKAALDTVAASLVPATDLIHRNGSVTYTANQPMGAFKIELNPTCQNYAFSAGSTATLGPYSLHGHLLKFSVDGYAGNVATTGAIVTVNGCTTFPNTGGNVQTCSCDLVGGSGTCAQYDGTSGATGFIVAAPQQVSVTIVSAVNDGSIDICDF